MRRAELITGVIVLVAALVGIFVVVPAQTEHAPAVSIQPRVYPTIALWAVVATSALLAVNAALALRRAPDTPAPLRAANLQTLLLVGVILAAAFVAMDVIGFLAGGIGLVAALMLFMGVRNPIVLVSVAIGSPAVIWLFFEVLLERPLP